MLFSALLTAFAYHTTKYILYRRRIDIALAAVALPVVALTKVTGLFLALGVAALSLVVLRGWGARTFAFLLFGSIAGFWFLKTQVVQDDWLTPAISAKPAAFLIFALAASGAVALWKGRLPGGLFPGPTRLRPNWSLRSTWRVLLVLWPLLIIAIPYFWYIQDTGTPLSYSLPFTQVGLGATESELWAEELYSAAGLSQLTTFAAPGTPHNLPFAIITDFRILPGLAPLVFLGLIVGLLGRRSSLWRLNALLVIFAYVSWILLFEMRVPRHYLFIAPFLATGAAMGLMAAVTAFNQRNTGKASVAALVLVGALVVSLPYQFVTFSYLSFLDFPESFFSFLGTARDWFSGSHLKAGFRVQAEATTGMLVVLIGTILARRYLIARFIEIHFPRGLPFSVSFNFGSITLFLTAGAAIIVIVALSVPQVRFLADHPRTELVEKAFGETYHRGELKALEVARLRSIDNGERSTLVSFYGWGVEYGTRGTLRNVILSDFRQMAQLRPYFTGETNGRLEDIVSGAKGDVIYLLPSLSTGHGRILADIASQLPTDRLIDLYNPAYYKQEFATSGWTLSSPTDFKLKVGEVTSMSSSIGTGVLSAKSTGTNVIQADPVDGSITFASAEVADYGFLRYALSPGTDGRVLNLNFGLDLLEPPVGFQLLLVQDEADATVLALRLNGEILSISAQGLTEKTELEDAGNTIDLTVSQIQNNTLTRLKINGREFIATGGGEPIARVFVGDTSSRVGVGTIKLTSPSIRTDLLLLTEGGS